MLTQTDQLHIPGVILQTVWGIVESWKNITSFVKVHINYAQIAKQSVGLLVHPKHLLVINSAYLKHNGVLILMVLTVVTISIDWNVTKVVACQVTVHWSQGHFPEKKYEHLSTSIFFNSREEFSSLLLCYTTTNQPQTCRALPNNLGVWYLQCNLI